MNNPIKMIPVDSTQIHSIGHDPDSNTLAVRFSHGNTLYHYAGVSPEKFEALRNADSVGSHLGKHIKGVRDYKKMEG